MPELSMGLTTVGEIWDRAIVSPLPQAFGRHVLRPQTGLRTGASRSKIKSVKCTGERPLHKIRVYVDTSVFGGMQTRSSPKPRMHSLSACAKADSFS